MKKSKLLFKEFFICTIVPFILPFINEIPDSVINAPARIILIFLFLGLDSVWAMRYFMHTASKNFKEIENKLARKSYSNAFELNERKRDYVTSCTYRADYSIPKDMIPYNIHNYIAEICKNFRNTISEVTNISQEHMSVTFIYHYTYDKADDESKKWRWVVGKESTMRTPLDIFVQKKDSLYYYLINGDDRGNINSVFCNDKRELEKASHYYMSSRDEDHNKIGSVFAIKVIFSNNAESFVEGILLISTHGKRFIEKDNEEYTIGELKNLLFEELFPYYQRLLETELGILYLQHIYDNKKSESDS